MSGGPDGSDARRAAGGGTGADDLARAGGLLVAGIGFQLSPPGPGRRFVDGPALEAVGPANEVVPEGDGWCWASGVLESAGTDGTWQAVAGTGGPAGRSLRIDLRRDEPGTTAVTVTVEGGGGTGEVVAVAQRFATRPDECFFGFGERSDRAVRREGTVEHYVGEGPWQEVEYQFLDGIVPAWGMRQRADATYYPLPWVLSSLGYGVLVANDELGYSRLRPGGHQRWQAEVVATTLSYWLFDGPGPAGALGRMTHLTGRQPEPAAPWFFGPWFQTGHDNHVPLEEERRLLGLLRRAGGPVSAAETHCRYLPVGEHRGHEDEERARTGFFHGEGLAVLSYLNPLVSTEFPEAYGPAAESGGLQRRRDGSPYAFDAYVGGRTPPVTTEAQFDFTTPAGAGGWGRVAGELAAAGHDGWMEDFGEYTPLDIAGERGPAGTAGHNRYPTEYHRAAAGVAGELSGRHGRPFARFARSGWTGTAPHVPVVWGGDPTTSWGFDGLASAVIEGLTMGASGVALWGSDTGGFVSGEEQLTPELLRRWIQCSALTPLLRTKAAGIEFHRYRRPQIWDPDVIGTWRRWAALHTQLNGYLLAAHEHYRRTGFPIMAALGLAFPDDPGGTSCEDQFLLGPDLLVAPVLQPGAASRTLHLPPGDWIDLWRAARYDPATRGLVVTGSTPAGTLVPGPGAVTLPAPADEIPVLVRAGSVLALLSPDVDTLSPYAPPPGVVSAADREDVRHLLAFPRGRRSGLLGPGERVESVEEGGCWRLRIEGRRSRRYRLQADLGTLAEPFTPGRLRLDGRELPGAEWRYDPATGVLVVEISATTAELVVG